MFYLADLKHNERTHITHKRRIPATVEMPSPVYRCSSPLARRLDNADTQFRDAEAARRNSEE